MSSFEDAIIQRIKQLEREVGRLQRWERPTGGDGLDGWCYDTDTWTYVSATSFKVTGKDVRYRFPKGTKIKLVNDANTNYFYVVATAFSTDTTITITGGSDYSLAEAAISGQAYSYAAAPQYFPQWFNFTPTVTYAGGTTDPTSLTINYAYFSIIGTSVHTIIHGTLVRGSGDRTVIYFTTPLSVSGDFTGSVTINFNGYKTCANFNTSATSHRCDVTGMTSDGFIRVDYLARI
jgi:hypothetical protein